MDTFDVNIEITPDYGLVMDYLYSNLQNQNFEDVLNYFEKIQGKSVIVGDRIVNIQESTMSVKNAAVVLKGRIVEGSINSIILKFSNVGTKVSKIFGSDTDQYGFLPKLINLNEICSIATEDQINFLKKWQAIILAAQFFFVCKYVILENQSVNDQSIQESFRSYLANYLNGLGIPLEAEVVGHLVGWASQYN